MYSNKAPPHAMVAANALAWNVLKQPRTSTLNKNDKAIKISDAEQYELWHGSGLRNLPIQIQFRIQIQGK